MFEVRDNKEGRQDWLNDSGLLSHPDCNVSHIHRQTLTATMTYRVFSVTH